MINHSKPSLSIYQLVPAHIQGHDSSTFVLKEQPVMCFDEVDAIDWINTEGRSDVDYAVIKVFHND
jgi:hypothetical protein